MDRNEFLKLCERLGSPDDREVLETARAITAELEKSGMTWDEALAPDETPASAKSEEATDADVSSNDCEFPAEAPATDEDPAETAAANADFKKVYDNMVAFRNDAYLWWQVAEYTYDNFMIRTRPRG